MPARSGLIQVLLAISLRWRPLRLGLALGCVSLLLLAPAAEAGILDLSWNAPTTNSDGSPLTDLSGYRVYWGTSPGSTTPPCNTNSTLVGNVSTYQLTGLIEGTIYSVQVTALDTSGNESACSNEDSAAALPDPVDTTPPAPPSTPDLAAASDTGLSSTDNITTDTTPTFTGTAEAGSTVRIFSDGGQVGSGPATGGAYSITTSALSPGTHSITATATDAAGNTSSPSGALSVTIDTTAPTAAVTEPAGGTTVSGTVTVTASASDNVGIVGVDFFVGTTLIGTDTAGPYSVAWNTTTVANGSHTLTARARDAAGNTATSAPVTVTASNTSPAPGPSPASEGGAGCFIATAAYGSALEPQVVLLRAFRDRYLLTTSPGRAFVQWYYRTSPPVAELIRQSPMLRGLVRVALWPLVGVAWLTLHPGVGATVLGGIGGLAGWRRSRRKTSPRAPAGAL